MNIHPKPRKPKNKCPFCDPDSKRRDPFRESQCVLNKPLFMVIPPGGVHLDCPVHPEGHHVFGPSITWLESPRWGEENNLPNPADKPWCEYDSTRKFIDYDSTRQFTDYDSSRPFRTTGDNIF